MNPSLVLVLGGARSGKSRFAERLAGRLAGEAPVLYVATALASDPEMAERIARHRADRPAHWQTVEAPRAVAAAVAAVRADPRPVVLLDCLTTLASNWLMQHGIVEDAAVAAAVEADLERELEDLGRQAGSLIVVSNEVGMGIVPAYPLGRLFRDLSGRLHQSLARRADAVYLMVAGLPVEVKALAVGGELYDGD